MILITPPYIGVLKRMLSEENLIYFRENYRKKDPTWPLTEKQVTSQFCTEVVPCHYFWFFYFIIKYLNVWRRHRSISYLNMWRRHRIITETSFFISSSYQFSPFSGGFLSPFLRLVLSLTHGPNHNWMGY